MISDHFDGVACGPGGLIDIDATGFHGGTRLFGVATCLLYVTTLTEGAGTCAHPKRFVVACEERLTFKSRDNFDHLDSP